MANSSKTTPSASTPSSAPSTTSSDTSSHTPITIALYGDWGAGKSSALRWLRHQLHQWNQGSNEDRQGHPQVRTVWFEPWKYHQRDDVWRGIISEVIIHSIDLKNASLPTVTNAIRQFGGFLGRSFVNVIASAKLAVGDKNTTGQATLDLRAIREIIDDYQKTTHPEKAYLNEFETTLAQWVQNSLAKGERMAIFIDDLDRCLPQVTLEVLEALKLYLNIPQLIFVVGLDRTVVDAVVRKHYETHGLNPAKAERYLDKMFQVEVEVSPSHGQFGKYLPNLIKRLDKRTKPDTWSSRLADAGAEIEYPVKELVERKISLLCETNPREGKRLISSALLRGDAASRAPALGGSSALRFAQGVQIYLIQKFLRRGFAGVIEPNWLIRGPQAASYFQTLSQLRQALGPLSLEELDEKLDAKEDRNAARDSDSPAVRAKGLTSTQRDLYDQALSLRPLDHEKKFIAIDRSTHLWDLMAIPFSASVAAAVAVDTSTDAPAPRSTIADWPQQIRTAIAQALDKPIEDLTEADLKQVTELDLSDSEVEDISPLAGLTALQVLGLTGTPVSEADVEALRRQLPNCRFYI